MMKKVISGICLIYVLTAANITAQQTVPAQPASEGANAAGSKDIIADGYGGLLWGTILSEAKDKIEGKLFFSDDQKIIISKDGELEYHYGFFYIDPAKYAKEPVSADPADDRQAKDEGKLFYVSLKFPYLTMETVKQKLTDKYGEPTFEDVTKNTGAIAWNAEKTIIIMWVDQYEKRAFCRRISYISKETTKELNEYMESVFHQIEIDVIKKLNP